ncbi:NYN domain-containing protein [Streptomyces sp. NPDC018019]|uniref:NYN domain-containing protein n=1 Tax=Streptomyces sp. NPDC018019 TaxID=3365030 RepID=UPI003793A043
MAVPTSTEPLDAEGSAGPRRRDHGGGRRGPRSPGWAGWPGRAKWTGPAQWFPWAGRLAALWSLAYGAAGLYWALGGGSYPFAATIADRSSASLLEPSRADVVGYAIAAVGAAGTVAGLLMARGRIRGRARGWLLGFGWAMAGALALLIPDYSPLGLLVFAPLLVVFAFTGIPGPQDGVGDVLYWHRGNLLIVFLGGLLWALATLAYQRRTGGRCVRCGRGRHTPSRWTTPEAARRWGRWAVYAAVVSTLPYDVTRIAWYFDRPLGISDAFLADMRNTPGMLEIGLGLAAASALGGLLTHGLTSRWGEVWPRWVWWKAGRPVRPATALVPAVTVALVLVPGGLMNIRNFDPGMWGTNGPGMLWTVWGVALGAAALAYHFRRRGRCRRCGRG